ncbi:MAG: alpha/beta hydrolase [Chroococcales cyanobacterium]
MKAKVNAFLISSLLILFLGLILTVIFNPNRGIRSKAIAINSNSQQPLISRLYLPENPRYPLPVIILCHGVNNSKEMMIPLATELVRNNIAAIPFDFGGYGESYPLTGELKSINSLGKSTLEDAQAVLNYVRQNPKLFDPEKIGIIGHSLGGAAALELAKKEPKINVTGVLSISVDATPMKPKNLFLGDGDRSMSHLGCALVASSFPPGN